jgi:hypothetical protein
LRVGWAGRAMEAAFELLSPLCGGGGGGWRFEVEGKFAGRGGGKSVA